MTMCYPSTTDWGCAYTPEQIAEMRSSPEKLASMEWAEMLAWGTIASLAAYRIGVCPTVVRPCAAQCAGTGTWIEAPVGGSAAIGLPVMTIGSTFVPYLSGGSWYNACGCHSRNDCSCGALSEVMLPGPVGDIESVTIDGVVLDRAAYRVDGGNMLVRLDGDEWPICQDMSAAGDAAGGFQVSYYRGAAPNMLTQRAAGILASELFKACTGAKCRLPSKVTNVSRAGVTYEIEPGLWPNGMTGIREVDAVIHLYNPNGLRQPPRVLIPELRDKPRCKTWGF